MRPSLSELSTLTQGHDYSHDPRDHDEYQPSSRKEHDRTWVKLFCDGGTTFDGFLLAASQEVGQVILNLPYMFSLVGMTSGIVLQFVFATLALYTNFLLVSLHAHYRHIINTSPNHPKFRDPAHVVSYAEIMQHFLGARFGHFTRVIVYTSLVGLSTVQIIATSSNFYLLAPELSKRDWGLVWGVIFMFMLFIPNFRHYRVMSVLGVLSTSYTAWYMTAQSNLNGRGSDVQYSAPTSVSNYFRGFAAIMFTFGGHCSNIEVADVLNNPAHYDQSYRLSFLYVFTLTMPNAISVYYNYGDECRDNGNAFFLFERSVQRDIGIVLMCLHEMVAFGLFSGPLYHLWEKYCGVYGGPYWIRMLYRVPVAAFIVLLAVAFPFYGSVNAMLGAFTTSMATYIIPLVAYSVAFASPQAQEDMTKKPASWVHIPYMLGVNWLLAGLIFVGGVCIGGYASTSKFVDDVHKFKYFANCYEC